jgi:CheY-like chemotaxis protein
MSENKKILIVDDTELNIEILVELLSPYYDLSVALDGKTALNIVNKTKVDIILLDIMMPKMDGYEVCKKLKSQNNTKNIPIIFLTAKTDEDSIEKAYDFGGDDYISKPFKKKELLKRVENQLNLQELTNNLKNKIAQEKELNKQKDKFLAHQSKLALMGEMIDAVAHQWRQPLSIIQITMSNLSIKYKLDENISGDLINEVTSSINAQVRHMDETINVFRNYLRPNDKIKNVNLKSLIEGMILLIEHDLNNNSINLNYHCIDSLYINCVVDELKHVLLNIVNNSKDAFIQNNIKGNRYIDIKVSLNSDKLFIFIEDNAGGISNEIIQHIFDANFTTKKDSGGTGIGLYISKMFIEKIKGKLNAYNSSNGVVFKIEIPL